MLPKTQNFKNIQTSDFVQFIWDSKKGLENQKWLKEERKRDVQQIKIKQKFNLEEKRLNMKHEAKTHWMELELRHNTEMHCIALEERKMALQEQKFMLCQSQLIKDSTAWLFFDVLD